MLVRIEWTDVREGAAVKLMECRASVRDKRTSQAIVFAKGVSGFVIMPQFCGGLF